MNRKALAWAWQQPMTEQHKLLLVALAYLADDNATVRYDRQQLCEMASLDPIELQECIEHLEASEFIRVTRDHHVWRGEVITHISLKGRDEL